MKPLDPIFRPRSVAVIGASRERASVGRQIFDNLLAAGFRGPVYPVNQTAPEVRSVRAYASVLDIPDQVDLAIIVVPAGAVIDAVEQCGRKGVKGLVLITAGFRETGAEGTLREERLAILLREYGMRAIGPNCMGVLNTSPDVCLNATFSPTRVRHGKIAFVSQSGALGMAILDQAAELGLGLSYFVSLGNKTNVSTNDLLAEWADDPDVELILLYLENFGNPRRFVELARSIVMTKPIIAVKSGRTSAGARAACSHTGALAEGDAAIDALFEQCGILRAQSIQELFEYARAFSRAPLPRGRGVGIVTNSGGPAIMATDSLLAHGLHLGNLSDATRRAIRAKLPPEASDANPVDVTAGGGVDSIGHALAAVASDPSVDALLVIYTPPGVVDDEAVARAIIDADRQGKPLFVCALGREGGGTAFHRITDAGLPTYVFPESAVRALAALARRADRLRRPPDHVPQLKGVDRERAAGILRRALEAHDEWLTPEDAFSLFAAYGMPVLVPHRVKSPQEAREAARALGGKVVLKAIAPGLVHKTEAGGVRLEVEDAGLAFHDMRQSLARRGIHTEEMLVQPVAPPGREVILGMVADPKFGPLVAFGIGGIYVEVLNDLAFRAAPLTEEDARRMVRAIRAWPLLEGVRGEPPADVSAIEDALLRLSALTTDHSAIREIEANPMIVGRAGEGARVVDARVRLWPGGAPPHSPTIIRELTRTPM